MNRKMITVDGNEATASIAHRVSEVVAIYPITPSSSMAEHSDIWAAKGVQNIWGQVPRVVEMQSEGGAAGTVHGSLQAGALTTTFTASQGLLLMIPNMYKIAGELTPTVFHVSARSLAAQGLSIFGDHSDVMSTRQTGFAMLSSGSVQEAHDMALIAHAATLKTRLPFIHFFDGFRTSHEVMKIEELTNDDLKKMIDDEYVIAHRERGLTPDSPAIRGTSQNPDVYFQGRETVNNYYNDCPNIVQEYMDRFEEITGRQYSVVRYEGPKDAKKVIVVMASASETISETVKHLNSKEEMVGMLIIHLYRPFPAKEFLEALPDTVESIAVLDRTKEPGSYGEPLFQDVSTVLSQEHIQGRLERIPKILGGRYGLSSKEFTPAMVKAVFDELDLERKQPFFTIGIHDDVTQLSIPWDDSFHLKNNFFQGLFYGLGSDGTVGANKNSIKIIGESTDNYAQGYFVYDSKKSGSMTTSHLRFGREQIRAPYLIDKADFIACHHAPFLRSVDLLDDAKRDSIFLLNTSVPKEEVWDSLPTRVQEHILDKNIKLWAINGSQVAYEAGMGRRVNTIMQTCFFAISGVLPREEAIEKIKEAIKKTYGKKGQHVVQMNYQAVDLALEYLYQIEVPQKVTSEVAFGGQLSQNAPDFYKNITQEIISGRGDLLPVSAIPDDGTWPTGTAQYEKRDLSDMIPTWHIDLCTQCGKCAEICPHAVIRSKVYDKSDLVGVSDTFKSVKAKGFKEGDPLYTIQTSPLDCTGCQLCVEVCPGIDKKDPNRKALEMIDKAPIVEQEIIDWDYFLKLPEFDRTKVKKNVKHTQLLQPLFEFSGACSGCGETPYIKTLTQLFGDRMLIANATGCSSIYGGNLPTTPYTVDSNGRGPAWANSLFEDNAEFGLGFRLAVTKHANQAEILLDRVKDKLPEELIRSIHNQDQHEEIGIQEQRGHVAHLKELLKNIEGDDARRLEGLADYLVKKSVWIFGGDGWAYDIGFGGLDHVMSTGENVNILVMDTEVYSNTGGQASKATPKGAVAQFAASGKPAGKKDLGLMAMSYGNVYVAKIAIGANDAQTIKTLIEAEKFDGPSLIIAYSHCIAHGYDLKDGASHQKKAVQSGYWPLFRYNPDLALEGKPPFKLDSKDPIIPVGDYIGTENRFKMLFKSDPAKAKALAESLQRDVDKRWAHYKGLEAAQKLSN